MVDSPHPLYSLSSYFNKLPLEQLAHKMS
jgi:Transposase